MKDLVAEAVARTLGISSKYIAGWELNVQQEGMPGVPGMVRSSLQVKMVASHDSLRRLQMGERRGSWALNAVNVDSFRPGDTAARLDVILLYGKETQHIFKALAQLTVYRRNQRGRRK